MRYQVRGCSHKQALVPPLLEKSYDGWFQLYTPCTEHKVHRNLDWLACAWGSIVVRECPCDSSHQHYHKSVSNVTAVWHFYCSQIQGFLFHGTPQLFRLERPQEFIRSSLCAKQRLLWSQNNFPGALDSLFLKTLHFPHKKRTQFLTSSE